MRQNFLARRVAITTLIILGNVTLGFTQEKPEPEPTGIFYKKSIIQPDVVFLPFLGFSFTAYKMENEKRIIKNLNSYSTGSKIKDLSPGPGMGGGIGFFLPYANTRIVFEYQNGKVSNESTIKSGESTAYNLSHDMNVFLIEFDKLFQYKLTKYSVSNAYAGFGAGVILISDTRTSTLDYKYTGGSVGHFNSKIKSESYLAVVNLMAGKFNTTSGSVFIEIRAGYQFIFSTKIHGDKKPGFDPSDYSPNLNAFRASIIFGIII